ncbi:hypothetical protein Q8F55_008999 [Vanrija albida]|uniref:Uncharacterized protein n=1 Tax=Vanrija albida TaxID=181172 RepID=A0ABR3PSE8_9TREE
MRTTITAALGIVLAAVAGAQSTREWGSVWGDNSGATATASHPVPVAIESGNGTATSGQRPVIFAFPLARDTWIASSAGNGASWAPAAGVPTDLWLRAYPPKDDPVLIAGGIGPLETRASAGSAKLPVGKSFVLYLTRAGDTGVLATSQAFEITPHATNPANMAAGAGRLGAPLALVAAGVAAAWA